MLVCRNRVGVFSLEQRMKLAYSGHLRHHREMRGNSNLGITGPAGEVILDCSAARYSSAAAVRLEDPEILGSLACGISEGIPGGISEDPKGKPLNTSHVERQLAVVCV